MTLADEILQAAASRYVAVVGLIDRAAAPQQLCGARPHVHWARAAFGADRLAVPADALADPPTPQAAERLADEPSAEQLELAEPEAGVEGDRAGIEEGVAGDAVEPAQPADVAAHRDLAGVVGRAPAEPHAALEIRAAGALGGVGLGGEGALRRAGGGGERGALHGEPPGVGHPPPPAHPGGPEPQNPRPSA